MKILVLIKQVPDTEARLRLKTGACDIDREDINMIISPYDEYGVEDALQCVESAGGSVVAVTLGTQKSEEAVRSALAMGGERAIRIDSTGIEGSDPAATALALSKAIATEQFDIIICGKQAIDDDSAQVGTLVAAHLAIPVITYVTAFAPTPDGLSVTREMEGGSETLEVPTPCLLTIQKGHEARYPTVPNIIKARRKEIKILTPADLGLDPAQLSSANSKSTCLRLTTPPERQAGKTFTGEPEEIVPQVVRLLREEAKII